MIALSVKSSVFVRLLLWDCDGRCYSYYVDVSNNQQNWSRVINKTTEACRSWQTIVFDRQPITFIRIVGTHNTANEVQLVIAQCTDIQ